MDLKRTPQVCVLVSWSSLHAADGGEMVTPTINRKRGKTKEQRVRDNRRMVKANLKASGKMPKKLTTDKPGISKKKMKKNEQRARLLAKSMGGDVVMKE